ncbi:hypothetical protein C8Q80DRAFT_1119476 [Daedaleopsis nitida]|nr:hypothetical protein C8Q80DRAFT_1119476 [Daedaleopsis nitida]
MRTLHLLGDFRPPPLCQGVSLDWKSSYGKSTRITTNMRTGMKHRVCALFGCIDQASTPSSFCPETRSVYEEHIRGADANECFAPDKSFREEEHALIDSIRLAALHQAALLRLISSGDAEHPRIVSPEVLNMLSTILQHVFPDHEFCSSVSPMEEEDDDSDGDNEDDSAPAGAYGDDETDETDETGDINEGEFSSNDASSCRFRKHEHIGTPQQLLYTGDLKPQGPTVACVVHADGVSSVFTSALFHRHALGAMGPLIGISFQKTSPIVHIRIAWLDEALQEGNDLPVAHFFPDNPHSSAAVDLRDPLEALGLALFLHRTSRIREEEVNQLKLGVHQWHWRADLEVEAMLSQVDYSRRDCVSAWAAQVYKETIQVGCECDNDKFNTMPPQGTKGIRSTSDISREPVEAPTPRLARSTQPRSKTRSSSPVQARLAASTEVDDSWVDDACTSFYYSNAQRYFVTRGVIFCSARDGWMPWAEIPKEFKHSTAFLWFYGDPTKHLRQTISRNICTEQQKIMAELHDAYVMQAHLVLGYMTEEVQKVIERSLCSLLQIVMMSRAVNARKDICATRQPTAISGISSSISW